MSKLFIGCCIVIYTLCSSMAAFAQLFSFQSPAKQQNTLSASPTRTALSPDQFRQQVRAKGDANRKILTDLAKKNQKPLPANVTSHSSMGGASPNPVSNKTPPPPPVRTPPTSQPGTSGTSPSKTPPPPSQNPYYTGTQFPSGTGTSPQGGTGNQWNINY